MRKCVIIKKIWYNGQYYGYYTITSVTSTPDGPINRDKKYAFKDVNEANDRLFEIIQGDEPYRSRGYKFEYQIVEV